MKHKNFITTNTEHAPYVFERVSSWIEREYLYNIRSNHSLYEYRTDENGYKPTDSSFDESNGNYVDAYKYKGVYYAVERFYLLSNPFWMQGYNEHLVGLDGEKVELHAVDMDGNMYNPYYIEISADGESARFYKRIK